MERVNEFLAHVKERLSSPFFFSFVISWIFCNWQIVVALLWYDPPKEAAGHINLIQYINIQSNNVNSLLLPLVLACAYTFFGRSLIIGSLDSRHGTLSGEINGI